APPSAISPPPGAPGMVGSERVGWGSRGGLRGSIRVSCEGYRFPFDQGNPEAEAGAFAGEVNGFNVSAVGVQDGAGNGQAHARSFAALRAALTAVKLLEDQRQVDGVDARTGVFNGELQPVGSAPALEGDPGCGRGMAGGIFQKMAKHAAEQVGIEPGRLIILLNLDADLVGGQGFTRLFDGLIEKRARVL